MTAGKSTVFRAVAWRCRGAAHGLSPPRDGWGEPFEAPRFAAGEPDQRFLLAVAASIGRTSETVRCVSRLRGSRRSAAPYRRGRRAALKTNMALDLAINDATNEAMTFRCRHSAFAYQVRFDAPEVLRFNTLLRF